MASFSQIYRLSNCVLGGYKTVFSGRRNFLCPPVCDYTRKSPEQRLGIEKPKRPLTPFFKFMTQMRPALLAKNPGISAKEAILWSTKHWQQLDAETKAQLNKEYEKDREDYKKIKEIYEASLSDEQKADIKKVREEMATAREKRKLKAEYKELGRPKKPMSSYFMFLQSKKDKFQGKHLKEYQQEVSSEWAALPATEKLKYEKKASELLAKYRKELEAWELKMITIGRTDLVRAKPLRTKHTESKKKQ